MHLRNRKVMDARQPKHSEHVPTQRGFLLLSPTRSRSSRTHLKNHLLIRTVEKPHKNPKHRDRLPSESVANELTCCYPTTNGRIVVGLPVQGEGKESLNR